MVYVIHLYKDNESYCGTWHVPCPDGDPRATQLEEANIGRFRDESGRICRGFFFSDELVAQLQAAARTTECEATAGIYRAAVAS